MKAEAGYKMKGILKNELKRAFINRNMAIALLVGSVIAILQVKDCGIPALESLRYFDLYGKAEYPDSLFNTWIGGEGYTYHATLYNLLIPLIAVFPFAGSLYLDIKNGYVKNIFTKTNKRYYFISKSIAAFLSGGTAVVLPLLLNLFLMSMFVPAVRPDSATMMFSLNEKSMFSEIYYSNPFLYLLIFFTLMFFMSGMLCIICLAISFFVDNYFVILTSVFVIYIVEKYICEYFLDIKYAFSIFFRIDQSVSGLSISYILLKYGVCAVAALSTIFIEAGNEKNY